MLCYEVIMRTLQLQLRGHIEWGITKWFILVLQRVFTFRKGLSQGNMGMKSLVGFLSIPACMLVCEIKQNFGLAWAYSPCFKNVPSPPKRQTIVMLCVVWQLGGKGANLAEMSSIGLSVPPGLTITTETCHEYNQNGNKLPEGLWEEVLEALKTVEQDMGATLGDPSKPLLVSVRSGAAVKFPVL